MEIRTGTRLASIERGRATLTDGRAHPRPHRLLDHRGEALSRCSRGSACRSTSAPAGSWWTPPRGWRAARTSGRSATPPRCPTRPSAARRPRPPTAQHALRQGKVAADNVAAALAGGAAAPFRYRTLGVFVDMGRHKAVATMLACGCAASRPGSPPAPTTWRHAGRGPPAAPGDRLDGGALLRPRVRRARPARPSAAARQPLMEEQGRGGAPDGDAASALQGGTRRPTSGPPTSSPPCRCARRCGAAGWCRAAADPDDSSTRSGTRQRPLLEFIAGAARRRLLGLRGGGRARGLRARGALRPAWTSSARWRWHPDARRRRHRQGPARARLARAPDAASAAGWWSRSAPRPTSRSTPASA